MPQAADRWLTEFDQHRAEQSNPDVWAHSFVKQHGPGGWVSEFEQVSCIVIVLHHFHMLISPMLAIKTLVITCCSTIMENYCILIDKKINRLKTQRQQYLKIIVTGSTDDGLFATVLKI